MIGKAATSGDSRKFAEGSGDHPAQTKDYSLAASLEATVTFGWASLNLASPTSSRLLSRAS